MNRRADEATDEVDADDVERVIDAEAELQAHGQGAERAGEQAQARRRPTGR